MLTRTVPGAGHPFRLWVPAPWPAGGRADVSPPGAPGPCL